MSEFSPTITTWIILSTIAIWITWDVYLYRNNKVTISEVVNKWGNKSLPFVFALGFLCGHWFW